MKKLEKEALVEEIDVFLAASKSLHGPQPVWRANGRTNQLDAKWPIEEAGGISRAHLAFRYNRISTNEPSVSLIYNRAKICRVDVKPPDEYDGNPIQAKALGLPAVVYGPHIHKWANNRSFILDNAASDLWEIPIKEEVSKSTQTLGHILALICTECGIDFTSEQRDLNPPTYKDLFE